MQTGQDVAVKVIAGGRDSVQGQLADQAGGSVSRLFGFVRLLALRPTAVNVLLSWVFTRPRREKPKAG